MLFSRFSADFYQKEPKSGRFLSVFRQISICFISALYLLSICIQAASHLLSICI